MKWILSSLKFVTIPIGVLTACWLVYFPKTEGRAENLDVVSIYTDPFIIYAYSASLPFFLILIKTYQLISRIQSNGSLHEHLEIVKTIKNLAVLQIALIAFPLLYLVLFMRGVDDIAGGVAGGLFAITIFLIVFLSANLCTRLLYKQRKYKA